MKPYGIYGVKMRAGWADPAKGGYDGECQLYSVFLA